MLFIDRSETSAIASVFRADVNGRTIQPDASPLAMYGEDGELIAIPRQGRWVLAQEDGSPGWALPSGARAIRVSHDRSRVAWSEGSALPVNVDRRLRVVWVAQAAGAGVRRLIDIVGGDVLGWGRGDEFLLASGTPAGETQTGLWRIGLDAEADLLMAVDRVRGTLLSPDGGRLAFMVTFSGDAAMDGLWIVDTASGEDVRLDIFGSYRWRDENRLLVIPLNAAGGLSLVEVEVTGGTLRTLLPAGSFQGGIANNDWLPSPDGRWIVYLNAAEGNLWLAGIP